MLWPRISENSTLTRRRRHCNQGLENLRLDILCLLQSAVWYGLDTMLLNCAIEVYVVVAGIHCGVIL